MPYCLLLDNLAKVGHLREAKATFDEMREKHVRSDGYAYSIMITAFCRSGLLKEANQLAKEYEASYKRYDLVMLNTLLRAYCNSGDMESVMLLLKKMDELATSPDVNTFQILIKYFFKENLYHLAYRTIEDMHKKGHQLDEQDALMRLGCLTEEADKSTRAARVEDQLEAAQVLNSEMEAELRRLRVQSDQWRKAAEATAAALSPVNNGQFVQRFSCSLLCSRGKLR